MFEERLICFELPNGNRWVSVCRAEVYAFVSFMIRLILTAIQSFIEQLNSHRARLLNL